MKWLSNMKVGKKLTLAFLLIAALAGVIGTTGVMSIRNGVQEERHLYTYSVQSLSTWVTFSQTTRGSASLCATPF